jgi:hypothetical protein
LRPPRILTFKPDAPLRLKIAGYFQSVLGKEKRSDIEKRLPQVMPSWGKVRIAGGGDHIQAASALKKVPKRDCTWVRVIMFTKSILEHA